MLEITVSVTLIHQLLGRPISSRVKPAVTNICPKDTVWAWETFCLSHSHQRLCSPCLKVFKQASLASQSLSGLLCNADIAPCVASGKWRHCKPTSLKLNMQLTLDPTACTAELHPAGAAAVTTLEFRELQLLHQDPPSQQRLTLSGLLQTHFKCFCSLKTICL